MEEKKPKYYISFPITGRNIRDVKVYARRVKAAWESKGYEIVSPFELTEQYTGVKEEWPYYAYCMGRCVEAIMKCDGIIMCGDDWFYSKGCRLEYNVAEIYGKKVLMDRTEYIGRKVNGTEFQV